MVRSTETTMPNASHRALLRTRMARAVPAHEATRLPFVGARDVPTRMRPVCNRPGRTAQICTESGRNDFVGLSPARREFAPNSRLRLGWHFVVVLCDRHLHAAWECQCPTRRVT